MNATPVPHIPAPSGSERDADGRLVALDFAGGSPPAAGTANDWLVAVDGSAHSLRALDAALRMAETMTGCRLHLVNVQHWLGKEAAETELAQRGWAATAQARATLDAAGRPWQLHIAMGEAADCIIALAGRLGCAGIVVGSRGLGVTEGLLLGSVATRLARLSPHPVLLVR